ncbi:MAG: hypothetical protein HOJ29_03950, partial [Candidatus Magasanikbacteria bacterium]|nr:hypothetical protein [Candidatus Magasanikbacteria bacterium]
MFRRHSFSSIEKVGIYTLAFLFIGMELWGAFFLPSSFQSENVSSPLFYPVVQAATVTIDVTTSTDAYDTGAGANGSCSLREAIGKANGDNLPDCPYSAEPVSGDTIQINLSSGTTYNLTRDGAGLGDDNNDRGDLDIATSTAVTIAIAPTGTAYATIDASGLGTLERVMHIVTDGPSISLDKMVITSGDTNGAFSVGEGRGAGIYIANGDVTINNSVVKSNDSAFDGGGIYVESTGTLTLTSTTLHSNTVSGAAGGDAFGGGIYNDGTDLTITSSTFTSNVTSNTTVNDGHGGGLYTSGGTVT